MPESPSVGFQITSDPDLTTAEAPTAGAAVRERGGAYRLVLVADLDPQAPVPDWEAGDRVWDVDANTFADRMKAHGPTLRVSVPGLDGERTELEWTAAALDAFTPAGIAERVPALRAAAAAQAALADAPGGSLDDLRTKLRATGVAGADALAAAVAAGPSAGLASRPSDDDGSLDNLLGLVALDGDDTSAPPKNSALGALVDAASEPAGGVDRAAAQRASDNLASRLRQTLAAVVEHPDVRRAEAAWRGLRMLVKRMAFRDGARLSVLAAPKGALAEAVHFQVLLPEYEHGSERTPLAAVLLDHAVEATSADLAALGDLAASGASLQVPVVVSAAPAFFGLDAPTDFSKLPPATALLQQPEYAAFRSLRTRPDAAFLSLAVPPFLIRHAYGDDHPDKVHGVAGGERLWGGGALLVGLAMAEAHKSRGWPTAAAGQAVGDLPVRATRMGAMPLAATFGDSVLNDLARAGVLGFSGPLRTDRAVMGPPASAAVAGDSESAAQTSFSAAVMTALASHRALVIGPACAGLEPDAALQEIDRRFRAFLRGDGGPVDGDAVTVQYLDEHDTETSRTYGVRLRPPREVLPHPVGIVFGVEVPTTPAEPADAA
ncbi:type VI secretion system contractile sheath domain-containing protein [Rubrivirga marina]|uniref:TssC1 N-terminal domain-containing protein n=1 Tax=Rubrivirga marina TaxID=1196024 RepID=A0A271IZ08_9BACT|nr:type VI secretion system contractile sheath large subunit [Rubrivirga marina]PAP75739.1 hypothetical protein BSZ37_04435 [Rubrivirga marina]